MNNWVQFNQRPDEFAQYLKEAKGVDITGNSGIVKVFLIFDGVMIAVFGGCCCTAITKMEKETISKTNADIGKGV
jgi:hypothetical protein